MKRRISALFLIVMLITSGVSSLSVAQAAGKGKNKDNAADVKNYVLFSDNATVNGTKDVRPETDAANELIRNNLVVNGAMYADKKIFITASKVNANEVICADKFEIYTGTYASDNSIDEKVLKGGQDRIADISLYEEEGTYLCMVDLFTLRRSPSWLMDSRSSVLRSLILSPTCFAVKLLSFVIGLFTSLTLV